MVEVDTKRRAHAIGWALKLLCGMEIVGTDLNLEYVICRRRWHSFALVRASIVELHLNCEKLFGFLQGVQLRGHIRNPV